MREPDHMINFLLFFFQLKIILHYSENKMDLVDFNINTETK